MNQQDFWRGEFGSDYIARNVDAALLASNIHFFSGILGHMGVLPETILELGPNVGMNVRALKSLLPNAIFTGVEINESACKELAKLKCKVVNSSIEEYKVVEKHDLVLTKGVLIHINPEHLEATYETLYESSREWVLLAEYYNPTPVGIPYRGHEDKLFKRDFAGEMLEKYKNLKLVATGFSYHRDQFPQDDITWFLMRKNEQC